jgi:hypothetical protein
MARINAPELRSPVQANAPDLRYDLVLFWLFDSNTQGTPTQHRDVAAEPYARVPEHVAPAALSVQTEWDV